MNNLINLLQTKIAALTIPGIIQLGVIFVALFFIFSFLRCRRAFPVTIGTLMVYLFYLLAGIMGWTYIHDTLKLFVDLGPVALILIYSPELRSILEELGNILNIAKAKPVDEATAEKVTNAVIKLSKNNCGAIIVIEKNTQLDNITDQAEHLDALISTKLLVNIFAGKAPLHDGAVLIRSNRIYYAGCKLPMITTLKLDSEYGARHQATVNLSATCDAVSLVVSEEDGRISFVERGGLYHLTPATLGDVVKSAMGVKGYPASVRAEAAKKAAEEIKISENIEVNDQKKN